jgi:hypothetical protein
VFSPNFHRPSGLRPAKAFPGPVGLSNRTPFAMTSRVQALSAVLRLAFATSGDQEQPRGLGAFSLTPQAGLGLYAIIRF